MKISRSTFLILLILFITILAILSLTFIAGMLLNRASNELTFPSSNVEYTKWQLPDGAKTRFGKGAINDIKFSPDGTRFAVATTIGVWMYDAKTGNEISLLEGDRNNILHIAFSSDGNTLKGVNHNYGYVKVMHWNTTTGKHLSSIQDTENGKLLYTSDFSENGMRLAGIKVRNYNEVDLWTIGDTTIPMTISSIRMESESKIEPVIALSSDGRYLATTMSEKDNNPIQVWNADTGELLNILNGNSHRIEHLAFSPDVTTLASGDSYHIKLWDIQSNMSRVIYKSSYSSSWALTFSPNGKLIASGDDDGNVRICDVNGEKQGLHSFLRQYQQKSSLKGHKNEVSALAFSPDNKILISGSEDGTIRGSDVISRNQLFVIPGHSMEIEGVAELLEENNLISLHRSERQLLRWDINTGHQLSGTYFSGKSPEALSHDGKTLMIEAWFTFNKNKFKLWSIPKRKIQAVLKGHNYESSANPDFVFSPDGKRLASADFYDLNGNILMWDIDNPRRSFFQTIFFRPKSINLTRTLSGHTDKVNSMVFSPNGKMLASSGYDKKLCLWNVQTGENIFMQADHGVSGNSLVFSHDSKVLASGSYTRIVLWDTTTGLQINKTKGPDAVNILQFSPDNKILLSGTYTHGTIQLFDAQSLQLMSTHQGHSDGVVKLLFLSDRKSLVSASEDGTMLLWDWEKISQE